MSSETQTRWDGNLIIIILQDLISTCGRLCFSEFQRFPSQALRKRQMLPRAALVKTLPHQPRPDPRAAVWWSSSAPCWPLTGNRPSVGDSIGRGPRPRAKVSPGEAGPARAFRWVLPWEGWGLFMTALGWLLFCIYEWWWGEPELQREGGACSLFPPFSLTPSPAEGHLFPFSPHPKTLLGFFHSCPLGVAAVLHPARRGSLDPPKAPHPWREVWA